MVVSGAALASDTPIVTKSDWLQPGSNVRSFQHPGLVQFTAMVSRQGTPLSELKFRPVNLDGVAYDGTVEGTARSIGLREHLARTHTDAFLVMHNGAVVFERYFNGMAPHQRHLMMSVTKSFTGTLCAMLIDEGMIEADAALSAYVPQLADSAYGPIKIRDLLDMRSGIDYSEDYADPNADVWTYTASIGLQPTTENYTGPGTIRDYLPAMRKHAEPGGDFEYVTPVTEALVWLASEVSGQSFTDLLSKRIWSRLGMEHDAQFLTEPGNQALGGTGLVATARDLARFGQMLLQRGTYNGRQILSPAVVEGFIAGGDRKAFEPFAQAHPANRGFSYRDQWWVTHNEHGAFTAWGVFGQYLYIDPTANMVIVKQSSLPNAATEFADNNDFLFFHAVAKHLMGASASSPSEAI